MKLIITLILACSFSVFAHDEGHGPKLTDAPKQGGVISSVVLAKDAGLGTKAPMRYKAEIVRSQTGLVRLYFYDQKMEALKSGMLAEAANGILISGKKGKKTEQKFELKWVTDHFEGQAPKPLRKPFNIDVKVMEGSTELLVAFDNLD